MAEWLRSPPLDQQVYIEDLGSYHGADKLDSGFQLSVKLVPTSAGDKVRSKIHFDHLEEGDEVDPTMDATIKLSRPLLLLK